MTGAGILVTVPFGPEPDWRTDCDATSYNSGKGDKFVKALCREIEQRTPSFRGTTFTTACFAGAGPSCLSLDQLYRILQTLYNSIESDLVEQTFVVLPGAVDEGRAKVLCESGFDRVELRITDPDRSSNDFRILRAAGFPTVGLELPYSSDAREWERRLDALLRLEPDHATFHLSGKYDELALLAVLRRTRERLGAAGYESRALHHYARPGKESRFLEGIAAGAVLAGFGPGAPTFAGNEATANRADFNGYAAKAGKGESASQPCAREFVMRWQLAGASGLAADRAEPGAAREFVERGLLERRDGRLFVTDQGVIAFDRIVQSLAKTA